MNRYHITAYCVATLMMLAASGCMNQGSGNNSASASNTSALFNADNNATTNQNWGKWSALASGYLG